MQADQAACRSLIRQGSRSFFAASMLLPPEMRERAYTLYAFCRCADDAVDGDEACGDAAVQLAERLARAYAGDPLQTPVDRAFAALVERHAIPRELPEALLDGFAWDTAGRRYETLSELRAYAARVAGTVGAMMALLMGAREPSVIARACDLGVAMQLTNIARDVGEDARMGRIYLPLEWMRDAGIDPDDWLARPHYDARLGKVVQRLLAAADELYVRAVGGIAALPLTCRPGILAARLIYAEIGRALERAGLDSVSYRAVVPTRQKLWLLVRSFAATPFVAVLRKAPASPVLAEVRFLVDAVAAATPVDNGLSAVSAPWWDIDSRIGWVLDLFDSIERRQFDRETLAYSDSDLGTPATGGTA